MKDKTFSFSHLNVDEGLSPGAVNSFYRQKNGFLWIGTRSGLNRYDGYTIQTYNPDPSNTQVPQLADYKEIFEDPLGNIWISTPIGIQIFDPTRLMFSVEQSPILKKLGLPDKAVQQIFSSSEGVYWFIYEDGSLVHYLHKTGQSTNLRSCDDETGNTSYKIASITQDDEGNIWIMYKNALIEKFNAKSLECIQQISALQEYLSTEIRDYQMIIDNEHNFWIHYYSDVGVFYFNAKSGKILNFDNTSSKVSLSSNHVSHVEKDSRGYLWIGTDHDGITVVDPTSFETTMLQLFDLKSCKNTSAIQGRDDSSEMAI